MANVKKELVTKEYYDQLQAEYKNLIEVERPQVQEDIAFARQQGDLSENADYDAARNKQAEIEARIKDLEYILSNAEIINVKQSKNKVTATSTVVVYDTEDKCDYTYTLVGTIGSNPEQGKITINSSLGSALLGKSVGDKVEVVCGDGSTYEVMVKEIK